MSGQSSESIQTRAPHAAAQKLALHVASTTLATLPPEAVQAVRNFTLDLIGVGIAGTRSPYATGVRQAAAKWGSGAEAHVFATGEALPAPHAAFVNAFQAHALEFDCVHEEAVLHPFTVVIPVLLAEAQRTGLTGARFVSAVAVGVDVAAGLGVAAKSQIRFFRPATCGLFGAVAALSHARGLDADQTAHAFGYALAFASGTMQAHVEGTPALAASVAGAARSAFVAVDLVEAGLPGPMGSIDGPFGYLSLFELETALEPVLASLGQIWRAAEVSWKPFPSGRASHGGIDMIQQLVSAGLTADNLEQLKISAPPLIHHLVGRPIAPPPLEVNYARLCLPYVGAIALTRGDVGLTDFTPERLNDPVIHQLAARMQVVVNDVPEASAFVPQSARALLKDGQVLEVGIERLLGTPQRPLNRKAHLAKFRACCAFGFGDAKPALEDALIEAADQLTELTDVGQLGRLAAGILS
jgi:2-methylcitrate dehydratase PrpD